jgi:O-antigen ligase
MEKEKSIETSNSSEWFIPEITDEKPTILSGIIFFLFPVIFILATIAYGSVDSWALGLLSLGAGIIAILWFLDSFFKKSFAFNTSIIQLPLIGLILIGIIQILPIASSPVSGDLLSIPATNTLSIDPNTTRMAVIMLLVYLVFFAASLAYINSEKRLKTMVFTVIIFGSFMAFLGIIQFLSGTDSIYGLRPNNATSPFASYANKHHFAALMEMIVGLNLSLLYGEATKKDKRLLLVISVVLMGVCVLLTSSRGGLLSLLAVVAFVTALNLFGKKSGHRESSSKGNKFLLIGASLTFIVVLLGTALFLGAGADLKRGTGMTQMEDVSTGRFHFWGIALQVIKDNPIIGTGLDTFGIIFPKHDTWNGSLRVEQSHNDYLQILADAGILGFLCVAAFIFLLFKLSLSLINQTHDKFRRGAAIGALAGCFGILFHSFFDFPLRTPSNPFIFLTLVVIAVSSVGATKLHRKHH